MAAYFLHLNKRYSKELRQRDECSKLIKTFCLKYN